MSSIPAAQVELALRGMQACVRQTLMASNSQSELDFGVVKSFTDKGFGFVTSKVHLRREIFFHISTINDPATRQYLDSTRSQKPDKYEASFWYVAADTYKGLRAVESWTNCSQIPSNVFEASIGDVISCLSQIQVFVDLEVMLSQLFGDLRISDKQLDELTNSSLFRQNPNKVLPILRPSHRDKYASKLNLPNVWRNIDSNVPVWIDEVTCSIFGDDQWNMFKQERERLQAEKESRLAEQRRLFAEQTAKARMEREIEERAEKQRRIQVGLQRFRHNATGIRYEIALRSVCINCSSQDVIDKTSNWKQCNKCKAEWYVNRCWNCKKNVDSRDPEIPKCLVCGWYKCAACDACDPDCSTNPYRKDNQMFNDDVPF